MSINEQIEIEEVATLQEETPTTDKETRAWDEMTKKIKSYSNELKETKAELKKLRAIEADYQESNARLLEYEAKFKQDEISAELKTFAKDFKIPEPVLAKELQKYTDEDIFKNAGKLNKLLLSESYDTLLPYIKGTTTNTSSNNIPIINGSSGAVAQPTSDLSDLAKAFVENKKQPTHLQIFKK